MSCRPRRSVAEGSYAIHYISGTELVFYYNYDSPEPHGPCDTPRDIPHA